MEAKITEGKRLVAASTRLALLQTENSPISYSFPPLPSILQIFPSQPHVKKVHLATSQPPSPSYVNTNPTTLPPAVLCGVHLAPYPPTLPPSHASSHLTAGADFSSFDLASAGLNEGIILGPRTLCLIPGGPASRGGSAVDPPSGKGVVRGGGGGGRDGERKKEEKEEEEEEEEERGEGRGGERRREEEE